METRPNPETILALDVGSSRIGVARARLDVPFPGPLTTLQNPERFVTDILELVSAEKAAAVVVGLPRGLNGQDTEQTAAVRDFVAKLEPQLQIPVYWSDEAVTSVRAEAELRKRGKPYAKADIDALAAVYILEDFMQGNPQLIHG